MTSTRFLDRRDISAAERYKYLTESESWRIGRRGSGGSASTA